MKTILFVLGVLMSSCIAGVNSVYNTLEDREIIVLEKRCVPGFTAYDRYMLKVREGNEYKWVMTSRFRYYDTKVGDTIKAVLSQSVLQ